MSKKKKHVQVPEEAIVHARRAPRIKMSLVVVVLLVAGAYALRFDSFKREHPLSFDESVYSMLGAQMAKAPGTYNTIPIYEDSLKKGRELPPYFKLPLFKHPPLFPWLIKQSYSMFGMNYYAAFRVSLLFGVLLIAAAYMMGRALFGERTGLAAAAIMFIEPVSWIASQKIWMETTLAFFTVLSLCLFAMTIRRYNPLLVLASGIAAGLAALCKYPGLLATGIIFAFALAADRGLFRKKAFLASLVIPFLALVPWMLWNYRVYGRELFSSNVEITHFISRVGYLFRNYWWAVIPAAASALLYAPMKRKMAGLVKGAGAGRLSASVWAVSAAAVLAVLFLVWPSVVRTSSLSHVPEAGWMMGMFAAAPWHFYLGRLIELSPFYILSFAGVLLFAADGERTKEYFFVCLAAFVMLGLYIMWGNFQSRYITAVTVPLVVLGSRTMVYALEKYAAPGRAARYAVIAGVTVFALYALARTVNMDMVLAIPNNVCYF